MYQNTANYDDDLLSIRRVPIYLKAENTFDSSSVYDMDTLQNSDWTHNREDLPTESSSNHKNDPAKTNIVIHVCDEAKNVKQDFSCPRDLLITEMKYFSDYFSSNMEKWEDVDISVHCDVLIFDWLMKYVKQDLPPENKGQERERPKLEPSNVISILISSDFLKMSKLVDECITFCHKYMSAIIAIPCNMNCINEKLVSRIAKLFSHNEAEVIKDKKDKFKSKLFCKKIEDLFNSNFGNDNCPSNASTLFRCLHCEKLLTSESHSKVECVGERTLIDSRGNLSYSHSRDTSWDINDYLINLKNSLKTWRNVFWRLWGTINYLYCTRCDEVFPCSEFGHCSFHPQQSIFNQEESDEKVENQETISAAGYYPCCNSLAIKFNPMNKTKGCTFRDHKVEIDASDKNKNITETNKTHLNTKGVLDQLVSYRDVICTPAKPARHRTDDVYISSILNPASMAPPHITTSPVSNAKRPESKHSGQTRPEHKSSYNRQKKSKFHVRNYEDEDQSDPEEQAIVRVVINQGNRNKKNIESKSSSTWDMSLPTRLNQDLQRESDLKRMNELLSNLTKSKIDETSKSENERTIENSETTAGTFCKIEQQLRATLAASKPQGSNTASATGSRQSRYSSSKPG